MSEKTPFLRIVGGGKDHKPERAEEGVSVSLENVNYKNVPSELVGKSYSDSTVNSLMDIFAALLHGQLDPSMEEEVYEEEAQKNAEMVKMLDVGSLRDYLVRADIWTKLPMTKAVLNEVAYRIARQDFSPRE